MRGLTNQLVRQLSAANHRTDGDLLDGFLTHNVEADFAELVRRHGSMVWSVCRRNLPDRTDAEDAFQTVFLVLVRRGGKLAGPHTIGPWLHRVAVWTARNVRRRNAHRLSKRESLTDEVPGVTIDRDISLDLDDALLSLPEKFRSSIVLCHLMGFSRADAAAQLGCPEGTLSAWLSRGLAKLRTKLSDRDPSRALSIAGLAVPAGLSATAVRAAVAFHVNTALTSALSSAVPQLVEGVIRMFWMKKATAATFALFAVFAIGVGVGVSTHQLTPAKGGQDNSAFLNTGGSADSPQVLSPAAQEPDLDKTLAVLEQQSKSIEELYQTALIGLKLVQEKVNLGLRQKINPSDLESDLETLARVKKEVEDAKKKLEVLKQTIDLLKGNKSQLDQATALKNKSKQKAPSEYQDPRKAELKAPQVAPDNLDKKIDELKKRQAELRAKLEVEVANSKVKESTMRVELDQIRDELANLAKQKEQNATRNKLPTKLTGGYFQLTVGAKDAAWPFVIKEYGTDGKLIGTTGLENSTVFGLFLTRAMKDTAAPKEVRITAQENASQELLKTAFALCQAAGVSQVSIKGGNATDLNEATQKWMDLAQKQAALREEEAAQEAARRAEKARDALNRQVERERESLRRLEELKDLKQLDELKKQDELKKLELEKAVKMYREAIKKAEEMLKKQKQIEPPSPQKQ
jgi:RNA polymerase sigma factor (sigma-70 family)